MKKGKEQFWVIIPAAGTGKRVGSTTPKQYLPLNGKPIIAHSIDIFLTHPLIQKIVVVTANDDIYFSPIQSTFPAEKLLTTTGGNQRQISVYQGLLALQSMAKQDDWVLVHDAVRPYVCSQDIDCLITTLQHHPVGGLLGTRARDTLKRTNAQNEIISTIDRAHVWQAQTPQMFRYGLLYEALKKAIAENRQMTDESSAIEYAGYHPLMVEGSRQNIKITYVEDLYLVHGKNIL